MKKQEWEGEGNRKVAFAYYKSLSYVELIIMEWFVNGMR